MLGEQNVKQYARDLRLTSIPSDRARAGGLWREEYSNSRGGVRNRGAGTATDGRPGDVLDYSFQNKYNVDMARPKAFDKDRALDAAIGVFRLHGFEGTSTEMLTQAMGIGRQSLYDTYGDKWQLYCLAVERYASNEASAHLSALRGKTRAFDGIAAMIARVIAEADHACLGVHSICEFGHSQPDLSAIHARAHHALASAIAARAAEAQSDGEIAAALTPEAVATHVMASFAAIRIAARGGADAAQLEIVGSMTLRALR